MYTYSIGDVVILSLCVDHFAPVSLHICRFRCGHDDVTEVCHLLRLANTNLCTRLTWISDIHDCLAMTIFQVSVS